MATKQELLDLLEREGWEQDANGRYIRDECYVAFLGDTVVRFFDGGPPGADDDTMRAVSGTMTLDAAMAWVRKRSPARPKT